MNAVHNAEETTQQISLVEKGLRESEKLREYAKTRKDMYEKQIKETDEGLAKLGVDPEKGEEELRNLSNEINDKLREIAKVIPFELLKKCQYITDADIPKGLLEETV